MAEPQDRKIALERLNSILRITENINRLNDLELILERILYESRKFTNADAGSIFIVVEDKLEFSFVQNDTLDSKMGYLSQSMPIDESSIVGYAATKGDTVVVDDAYNIDNNLPYKFNASFDLKSNYKTRSILAVPLKNSQSRVLGVLQIINSKDIAGNTVPFSEADIFYISYFANSSASAIERAEMTRELILRMLRMSELRDPKETGAHVNRVGAYSAEIYAHWAKKKGYDPEYISRRKDLIRIAAMLHDVGKVAIADAILKKPEALDDKEFDIMKYHTIFGARLFWNSTSELDKISADIAISHHERWDGNGYPGEIEDILAADCPLGKGIPGPEIPIEGRICALADVYDALISKRSYKDAWPEEEVVNHIKEMSGSHFDPEVVDAFLEIYDVIKSIREKYQGEQ